MVKPSTPITVSLEREEWAVVLAALTLLERISFDEEPAAIAGKLRDATA